MLDHTRAKELQEDFARDMITFLDKWKGNFAIMGCADEFPAFLTLALCDALVGTVIGAEIAVGSQNSLLPSVLERLKESHSRAWTRAPEIKEAAFRQARSN